jgi:hypothetical protein
LNPAPFATEIRFLDYQNTLFVNCGAERLVSSDRRRIQDHLVAAYKEEAMTILESTFHYGLQPDERALQALGRVRQVYGVRKTWLNERVKTIRVEYDASPLGNNIVALLRSAGIGVYRAKAAASLAQAA